MELKRSTSKSGSTYRILKENVYWKMYVIEKKERDWWVPAFTPQKVYTDLVVALNTLDKLLKE